MLDSHRPNKDGWKPTKTITGSATQTETDRMGQTNEHNGRIGQAIKEWLEQR